MENITYHKAGPNDLQALIDNRIAFTLELAGPQSSEDIASLKKGLKSYFTETLKTNASIWYIAKAGSAVAGIGGLVFRLHPGNFKTPSGRSGYIINMYTVPAFRKKGVCSGILNALIDDARRSGVNFFELHATKAGEFAYIKNGFIIHNEPTYRKYTE